MSPKPKRTMGRLGQLSKRLRLVRRALGQWSPTPQQTRTGPITRLALEEEALREGV